MQQLTDRERSLEAQLEEANKQVRALKEDADNLKDTETVEAQHVQVGRSTLREHFFASRCTDSYIQVGTCSCYALFLQLPEPSNVCHNVHSV